MVPSLLNEWANIKQYKFNEGFVYRALVGIILYFFYWSITNIDRPFN